MSYCVHCGVELSPDLKECPLCGTVVNDPVPPKHVDVRYVDLLETKDKHINRHFFVSLINIICFMSIFVTVIVDLCISHRLTWSLYVLGAELMLWVLIILPIRYTFSSVYVYLIFDYLTTSLFMLLVFLLLKANKWYLCLALPINTILWICIIVIATAIKKSKPKIMICSLIVFSIALMPVAVDIFIKIYNGVSAIPGWSLWATIPLLVISICLFIISKNRKVSDWIRKNLFI